jgi:hypothetical protein
MPQHWNELISNVILRRRCKYFWRGLVSLVAVGLVAIFAFSYVFTTFSHYDDEGYFLQSYRDFLRGQVPYDQLFSFYGPFSFYSAALIARLDAANVTPDNFRWAMIAAWIVVASVIAGVVWRWTRQFSSTVVAFLLVGFRLRGLAVAVGHPALWTILGVAILLWVGLDWMYLPGKQRRAFWTGFVVGIIILCKINLGIFVFLATALAVALQFKGRFRTPAIGLLVIAAAGLGLLLFLAGTIASEKYFAVAYLGSLAMTIGVAIVRPVKQQPSLTGLSWLAAGLGICLCAGVGVILACGTTPQALFRSLVTYPALFAKSYHNPFVNATTKPSILLSVVALSYAVLALRWHRLTDLRALRIGQLKVTAGAGLVWALFYDHRLALTGSLLFLWLLIVDAQPMSDGEYSNRLLLALLGSLFSLQVFPMAGQQVDWAALIPITAAVILLADGTNCIHRESYRMRVPRLSRIFAGAIGTLLALLLFLSVGRNAMLRFSEWRDAQSVNLPGTHWLRLSPEDANRLTVTVQELSRNCREVLMFPGLYSFSLWSGVPPVEKTRINSWPFLLPDDVRNEALPKLRQRDRECVIVSSEIYQFFRQSAVSPGNDEFLSEVERTMRPIRTIQDLTLYSSWQGPDITPNSAGPGVHPQGTAAVN